MPTKTEIFERAAFAVTHTRPVEYEYIVAQLENGLVFARIFFVRRCGKTAGMLTPFKVG